MGIVLFAIIGAKVGMGAGYWICYALYCATCLIDAIIKSIQEND